MERDVFASDGNYIISRITDDDRESYTKLHIQLNGEDSFYNNPKSSDLMWEATVEGHDEVYSILDRTGKYYGSIEVQNPEREHPELGIDLLEEERNKGIAPQIIRLFAQKYSELYHKEYFIVRILEKNTHSRHVFEKIGAEFIYEDENEYEEIMKAMKASLDTERTGKLEEILGKYLEDEGTVRIYKLTPNF